MLMHHAVQVVVVVEALCSSDSSPNHRTDLSTAAVTSVCWSQSHEPRAAVIASDFCFITGRSYETEMPHKDPPLQKYLQTGMHHMKAILFTGNSVIKAPPRGFTFHSSVCTYTHTSCSRQTPTAPNIYKRKLQRREVWVQRLCVVWTRHTSRTCPPPPTNPGPEFPLHGVMRVLGVCGWHRSSAGTDTHSFTVCFCFCCRLISGQLFILLIYNICHLCVRCCFNRETSLMLRPVSFHDLSA